MAGGRDGRGRGRLLLLMPVSLSLTLLLSITHWAGGRLSSLYTLHRVTFFLQSRVPGQLHKIGVEGQSVRYPLRIFPARAH